MKRFDVISESKFERMSHSDMSSVKGGGICLSCMKREKKKKKNGRRQSGWTLKTGSY